MKVLVGRIHRVAAAFAAAAVMTVPFARIRAQEHDAAKAAPKAKSGSSMAFIRLTDDGRLHMAYVEDKDGVKTVRYRQMFGDVPVESAVSEPGYALSHWPESPPIVEVMRDGAIHVLYTARVEAKPGGDAYPVELRLATSADSGRTWQPYRVMGDESVSVYRGCAAMREDAQGDLVLSWLEGRPGQAAVGVKAALMRDGKFEHTFAVEKACECCGTELIFASDGTMWLAYRGVDSVNVRDMFLTRMTPGAARFGPPARISRDRWFIPGCPDTGPRFTLSGEDTVWVAWYSGNPRGVYASRAATAKPQFAARELVQGTDDHVSSMAHPAIVTLPDGRVLVAYECKRDSVDRMEGRAREGTGWGEPIALGGKGEYPRIAANGQKAYLVYTAVGDGQKSIVVRDLADAIPPVQ